MPILPIFLINREPVNEDHGEDFDLQIGFT